MQTSTTPSASAAGRLAPCYQDWSFEELRRLAVQLQLADAARKSRGELLDLLAGGSRRGGFQSLENRRQTASPGLR